MPLDTADYDRYVDRSLDVYGCPHGVTTLIGVTSLYERTAIGDEAQVYFGHHTDTLSCSTPTQVVAYLTHRLPVAVKRRLHPSLKFKDPVRSFFSFQSQGAFTDYQDLPSEYRERNVMQALTLASMYVSQSQAHGEVLVAPVIRHGAVASDPFYDMDLVEFCLRIPLRRRLAFSRDAQSKVTLEKRTFQKLAARYLPKDMVYRKKAFTVPFGRDEASRKFVDGLPTAYGERKITHLPHRFAAEVLNRFARERGLAQTPERADAGRA